jgi:hypothetical protein
MSNEAQTAVGWFSNQAYELFEQYSEGNFDRITLNKLMLEATNKAKEMEKQRIIKACDAGFDTANLFIEDMKYNSAEDYYEKTYGGNK